jgi:hypothetical protein
VIYGFVIAGALAYLAKGTAAVFLSGFIIVYGIGLVLQRRSWKVWLHLFFSGSIGAAILAGHELRLFHAYGSFKGPSSAETSVVHPDWRGTVFNALRDFASNLNITDDAKRLKIESQIIAAGQKLGIHDADGRYSFLALPFHLNPSIIALHEDAAPSMVHVFLIIIVMSGLLILAIASTGWRGRNWPMVRYGIALALSMIAFCALIKWQPWITRLQLGEFVLAMPLVAVPLSSFLGIAMPLLVIFLGWQAKDPVFNNLTRPLLGEHSILKRAPVDILFSNRPDIENDYVHIAEMIAARRPKQVGVVIGGDGWEFPLWFLLRERLAASEMPIITYEMDQKAIDPHIDLIVYVDYGHPVLKGMREITGSGQAFLYERQE